MIKETLILILFCCSFNLYAQKNLVKDSSFEQYNFIPDNYLNSSDKFNQVLSNWCAPTDGTPDYHHRLSAGKTNKVPINFLKTINYPICANYQETKSGDAYVGFFSVVSFTSDNTTKNEYIQTKLTESMIENHSYRIRFYINKSHCSYMSFSNIGALISKDSIRQFYPNSNDYPNYSNFENDYNPQIALKNIDDIDTLKWHPIEGVYKAKGGEKWLTIGHFNKENEFIQVEDTLWGATSFVYYLIDDVSVYEMKSVIYPDSVCYGDTVTLTTNFEGPYVWKIDGKMVSYDSIFVFVAPDKPVNVTLISKYRVDSFSVFVDTSAVFNLGNDKKICRGDSLQLIPSKVGNYYSYLWNDGDKSDSKTVKKKGIFWLRKETQYCYFTDSVEVVVDDKPSLEINSIVPFCYSMPLIQIEVKGNARIKWLIDNDTSQTKSFFKVGMYQFTLSDHNGCHLDSEIVVDNFCTSDVWIPNAFSPSGINKVFKITTLNVENYKLLIFNRWGELMSILDKDHPFWDGKYKGENCELGIYFYTLEYTDLFGNSYKSKGFLELLN